MVTRADKLTQTRKQKEVYSDFVDSFFPSFNGNDLARVTNEKAVRQAVKNLVLTNFGERLYQPLIGTDVYRSLFEPNDITTFTSLQAKIESTIKYYEPRAYEVIVKVLPSQDQHYLIINIIFGIINNPDPINITLNLKRVR